MLLDHHDVDALGVPESQKAEATGTTRRTVAHDSALADLSKLGEIIFERIYTHKLAKHIRHGVLDANALIG